jgi:YVTN family beta-propeller protein
VCAAAVAIGALGQHVGAQAQTSELDFEFFRARVQPVLVAKRPGHARCVACHGDSATNLRPHLAPLAEGSSVWNEADSRKNFAEFSRVAVPGSLKSPLLVHPLEQSAGGDAAHTGGKHFSSQNDPEWKVLKAWVFGAKVVPSPATSKVRILQTNSAGDNIHIIDPATNEVVGQITGIEVNHGVAPTPDGTRIYVSDEVERTVDVVDGKTLQVIKRIPLTGHPNNLAMGRDGRRVYVPIRSAPGGVDVIDTASMQKVKTIATDMPIHNTYVTPDGKFVLAGSMEGKTISVIDAATDQIAWTVNLGLGIRPMAMSANPDGSTKWIFAQLSELNGFAVVDFATRKEIHRFEFPPITPGKTPLPARGEIAHGLAVTPDGKTLVASSKPNSALYAYSLPDLKLIGTADMEGRGAAWVAVTPDSKRAYVSNSNTDDVSVIDIPTMKEIARIPVGFSPKRNGVWVLP